MFIIFWGGFAFSAHAEYRAFELVIKNKITGTERVVLSNLDPDQYRGYYPVSMGEEITYRDTWMCKGNTSGKFICAKPEKPSQGRDPKK